MNKKKIIIATSVIAIVVIVLICIIVNSKKENEIVNANDRLKELGISTEFKEKTKLKLTDEMIDEIKENLENSNTLSMGYIAFKINSHLGEDYQRVKHRITNKKQTDEYTYTAYVKFYYKDNYGNEKSDTLDIIFSAVEDLTNEKGYSIESDYKF